MYGDRFAQLMARHLSGAATPEETRELQVMLEESPEARYFFEVFSEFWKPQPALESNDIQEEIHFQQIIAIAEKGAELAPVYEPEAELPRTRYVTLRRTVVAAACLLAVVAAALWIGKRSGASQPPLVALHEIEAKPAAR